MLQPHTLNLVNCTTNKGDAFFTDAQQARLQELKRRLETLTAAEYAELEGLIKAAFDATIARTKSLMPVNDGR